MNKHARDQKPQEKQQVQEVQIEMHIFRAMQHVEQAKPQNYNWDHNKDCNNIGIQYGG